MRNGYQTGIYPTEMVNPNILAGTPLSTCVVLADSRCARIYMRHNRAFHFVMELEREDLAVSGLDNKTLGRGGGYGAGRHKYEPSLAESRQEEIGLAHDLARWLEQQYDLKRFKSLVLVAPPKMLGEIRKALSGAVANAIIAESNKQLMRYNDADLSAELLKIIPGPECEA